MRKNNNQNNDGYLILEKIVGNNQIYSLNLSKNCIIGRSSDCEIQILNSRISRRHIEISKENNQIYISQLSKNVNVLLNGKELLKKTKLLNNDKIQVLNKIFKFIQPNRKKIEKGINKAQIKETSNSFFNDFKVEKKLSFSKFSNGGNGFNSNSFNSIFKTDEKKNENIMNNKNIINKIGKIEKKKNEFSKPFFLTPIKENIDYPIDTTLTNIKALKFDEDKDEDIGIEMTRKKIEKPKNKFDFSILTPLKEKEYSLDTTLTDINAKLYNFNIDKDEITQKEYKNDNMNISKKNVFEKPNNIFNFPSRTNNNNSKYISKPKFNEKLLFSNNDNKKRNIIPKPSFKEIFPSPINSNSIINIKNNNEKKKKKRKSIIKTNKRSKARRVFSNNNTNFQKNNNERIKSRLISNNINKPIINNKRKKKKKVRFSISNQSKQNDNSTGYNFFKKSNSSLYNTTNNNTSSSSNSKKSISNTNNKKRKKRKRKRNPKDTIQQQKNQNRKFKKIKISSYRKNKIR